MIARGEHGAARSSGGSVDGAEEMVQGDEVPAAPSPIGRRQLLRAGGIAAAAAALLAACGDESPAAEGQVPQVGLGGTPTSAPAAPLTDTTLLRTAGSIARAAVTAHTQLLDSGKVTTPELVDAVKLFRSHHQAHIDLLDEAIDRLGGEPYGDENPLLMSRQVDPGIKALKDETTAVALAQHVETVVGDSYQLFTSLLSTGALRQQMMEMGGVVARQSAALAMALPYGVIVEVASTTAVPADATTTTTTTVPGTVVPDPVYAVPGPFGSTTVAVGPSFYV